MTTFNPHTATLDELRDWLAGEDGWIKPGTPIEDLDWKPRLGSWVRPRGDGEYESLGYDRREPHMPVPVHPHPPTRDGAAAALPEGMRAERRYCEHMSRWTWAVLEQMPSDVWLYRVSWVPDTGDEITDRYRLACLARVAMKEDSK